MDTDERRISDDGPDEPLYLVSLADAACGCAVGAAIWFVAGLVIVLAGIAAAKG